MPTPAAAARRRRVALATAAAAAGGYVAWRYYRSRREAEERAAAGLPPPPPSTLARWTAAASSSLEAAARARDAVAALAGLGAAVARDAADFVEGRTPDGEVPDSLAQLARLAASPDVARATASLAAAATAGALSALFDADRRSSPAATSSGDGGGDARLTPGSSTSSLAALAGGRGGGRAEALVILAVSAACKASTREYLDAMGYVRTPHPPHGGRAPPPVPAPTPPIPRPLNGGTLAASPDDAAATLTLVKATSPGAAAASRPTPARDPLLAALATVLEWAASPAGGAAVAGAASAASAAAVGAWLDRGAAGGGWGALVSAVCAPDNVPGAERLTRAGAAACVSALLDAAGATMPAAPARAQAARLRRAAGVDTPPAMANLGGEGGDAAAEEGGWVGGLARLARAPDARALALSLAAASASAGVKTAMGVAGSTIAAAPSAVRARVTAWAAERAKAARMAVPEAAGPPPPRPAARPGSARSAAPPPEPLPLVPALAVALLGALLAAAVAVAILRRAAVLSGLCAGGGPDDPLPWLAGRVCPPAA